MLQLRNDTPLSVERAVLLDQEGRRILVVAIKATCRLPQTDQGHAQLAAEQEPVCRAQVYAGTSGTSSLLRDCELVVAHPGTDVILNGSAYAPGRQKAAWVDVGLRIGPLQRTLRVYGDRTWQEGLFGWKASAAIPFSQMPLGYERAFGGTAVDSKGHRVAESRNPIGCGFYLTPPAHEAPLPNLEDPNLPITDWRMRPPPVGLGAIYGSWSPRLERAGTFDEIWRERRAPLWPVDFDPRFHQSAHPQLVSSEPLRGGELVELYNLTPTALSAFRLPAFRPTVESDVGGERVRQKVQIDRVIIEPDEDRVLVVWRSCIDCGMRMDLIKRTWVYLKRLV